VLRVVAIPVIIALWFLNRRRDLFKAIIYWDYLCLAFTTSFAFSPTDTMPLTRRAKMLMLLQSAISIITLTAIAGSAINILAGND
jgi:uncharacterized membrane protein